MATKEDGGIDFKLYRYTPSLVASIIFIILFVLTTAFYLYQVVCARLWYFTIFVVGGAYKFNYY